MRFQFVKPSIDLLESIEILFENKDFYFQTKRPETLGTGLIRNIVFVENSFLIYLFDQLVGIFSYEIDTIDQFAILINIRFSDMELLFNYLNEFVDVLFNYVENYSIVKIKTYEFDEQGIKLCEYLSLNIEAILHKQVFKNNCYHDVIIFSNEIRNIKYV